MKKECGVKQDTANKGRDKKTALWIGAVMWLTAAAFIRESNPFLVPMLLAVYYAGINQETFLFGKNRMRSVPILYMLAAAAGAGIYFLGIVIRGSSFYGKLSYSTTLKYSIMLVLVLASVVAARIIDDCYRKRPVKRRYRARRTINRTEAMVVICSICIVELNPFFFKHNTMEDYVLVLVSAVMAVCFVPVFQAGISTILIPSGKQIKEYTYTEKLLGVMLLTAVCLGGMPLVVFGYVKLTLICAVYASLYTMHRFGPSYGVALTAICGIILLVKTGNPYIVTDMLISAVIVMAARSLWDKRKTGTGIGAVLGTMAVGYFYDGQILQIENLITILAAIGIFMLTPNRWLAISDERKEDSGPGLSNLYNRLTAEKIRDLSGAFKRIEYTLAGYGPVNTRVSLEQVGEMIGHFSDQLLDVSVEAPFGEDELKEVMFRKGVDMTSFSIMENDLSRRTYYVTAGTRRGGIVLSKDIAEIMSDTFKRPIRTTLNTPTIISDTPKLFAFEDSASFKCNYNVRRIKKYGSACSGDNFSIKEYDDGRLTMMISDGMGSGSLASCESTLMIDTMEELLEAGFDPVYALSFSNGCIAEKNNGESFTTFDMGIIDLYSGKLQLYKQGAASTYVVREENFLKNNKGDGNYGQDIENIDIFSGTALPMGVLPEAECDIMETELYDGDLVVMCSDGVDMEQEEFKRLLVKISAGSCKEIIDNIMKLLMETSHGILQDDVTIIAAKIERQE